MKYLCICAFIFLEIGKSIGQDNPYKYRFKRAIDLKTFGNDSIKMSFNDTYHLIEDSCAQIIRYAHFNFQKGIFTGKIKDVSNEDPKLIVADGNYNDKGYKDGEFVVHYLNGNLQAKGSFTDDKYTGKWEFQYENGKPELSFEVVGNEYHILNAWNEEGRQIVINGKGKYRVNVFSGFSWSGKIVNGKPDGTWELKHDGDQDPVMTENFNKNQFINGESKVLSYTDSSHIVLVQKNRLLLCIAEQMLLSTGGCKTLKIIGARYSEGTDAYTEEIKNIVLDYLNKLYISNNYHNDFAIDGEIDEKGALINLNSHSTKSFDRRIIDQLYKLPLLQPATINGKPVKQKFTIIFTFENGYYVFTYKFLPIQNN